MVTVTDRASKRLSTDYLQVGQSASLTLFLALIAQLKLAEQQQS